MFQSRVSDANRAPRDNAPHVGVDGEEQVLEDDFAGSVSGSSEIKGRRDDFHVGGLDPAFGRVLQEDLFLRGHFDSIDANGWK